MAAVAMCDICGRVEELKELPSGQFALMHPWWSMKQKRTVVLACSGDCKMILQRNMKRGKVMVLHRVRMGPYVELEAN